MSIRFEGEISQEFLDILHYMEKELTKKFHIWALNEMHFIYGCLNVDSKVKQVFEKTINQENCEKIKTTLSSDFSKNSLSNNSPKYDKKFLDILFAFEEDRAKENELTSSKLLRLIISNNNYVKSFLSEYGNIETIDRELMEIDGENGKTTLPTVQAGNNKVIVPPVKHVRKSPINNNTTTPPQKPTTKQPIGSGLNTTNEVERNLDNLNLIATEGGIDEVVGNDSIIEKIFTVFCKHGKNNALIVGDSGIGKTATVKSIANRIVNEHVPGQFKKKILMQMDFVRLVSMTPIKGAFEARYTSIVNAAKATGKYIFFIDDIQSILQDKSHFGEIDIVTLLDRILSERMIQVVATCSNSGYRAFFETNPTLLRRFQVIQMDAPSIEESIDILHIVKKRIESFHNVTYDNKAIVSAVKLSSRYISDAKLPDSAIDLIDEAAARKVLSVKSNSDTESIFTHIKEIETEIEKDKILCAEPITITEFDIRDMIAYKTNIPVNQITENDKLRLRNLDKVLKKYVVGQDEAIDAVTKVIKRQRVGIANPNKPIVLLYCGMTGTGKTYLAKKIAKELYGDEKYLVRFDMSEYSDKASGNKLLGSAPGYIGFEHGGQLLNAVKKNKYCVLLLDEIEKANDEIHNIFLQLFDEGRLTDNVGNLVDFKNVIVIMTSNVGARQINEHGEGIGFNKNVSDSSKHILDKELKKAFKPEFLNRIDKVVYFNNLSEDSLKNIIKLEIKNVQTKVRGMGYDMDDSFLESKLVDDILESIKTEKNFGARPILRQVQDKLEDVITDYIINYDVENGHIFTYKELF